MKVLILSILLLLGATPAVADDFQSLQLAHYGVATTPHATYKKAPRSHPRGSQRHSNVAPRVATSPVIRDGRPRAWCGWYMRQVKGVSDPSFNLASRWLSYGRPSGPTLGAVVVFNHHVGYIVGGGPGNWIVRSGNYANRVADVPLSHMGRVIGYRS